MSRLVHRAYHHTRGQGCQTLRADKTTKYIHMESLLPTWWERHPPRRHWLMKDHETARLGGMPITEAVFDRIPDHDAFIPYYKYLCTWPSAKKSYRASRGKLLHARTVFYALTRHGFSQAAMDYLSPLLELNAAPVWENILTFILKESVMVTHESIHAILTSDLYSLFMNPDTKRRLVDWVELTLIPWASYQQSNHQNNNQLFTHQWNTTIKPAFVGAAATVYRRAEERCNLIKTELLATTWDYDVMIRFALDDADRTALLTRWQ